MIGTAKQVEFLTTEVFDEIAENIDKRIICLYGGSGSSKSISALQYLTMIAFRSKTPNVISIVGESVPVIKKSVFTDWRRYVMKDMFEPDMYNKQDNVYTFPNGSVFQFIPGDDPDRFHGLRHDYLMMDEAFNIKKAIFDQAEIRTKRQVLLTFNPTARFWATKLEDYRDDVAMLHSTYHKNQFIDPNIVKALEIRSKTDQNFYRVYVLGEYGSIEGLIFKEGEHWRKCREMPVEYKRRVIGLDWGYTDPTSIIDIRLAGGEIWLDEICYKTGMLNSDIYDVLRPIALEDRLEIIADSASPRAIAELSRKRLNVIPSVKGPDSIVQGLNLMKQFRINVTTRSIGLIDELRNYSWAKDRFGEYTGKPVDGFNHGIDGSRYGCSHMLERPKFREYSVS